MEETINRFIRDEGQWAVALLGRSGKTDFLLEHFRKQLGKESQSISAHYFHLGDLRKRNVSCRFLEYLTKLLAEGVRPQRATHIIYVDGISETFAERKELLQQIGQLAQQPEMRKSIKIILAARARGNYHEDTDIIDDLSICL